MAKVFLYLCLILITPFLLSHPSQKPLFNSSSLSIYQNGIQNSSTQLNYNVSSYQCSNRNCTFMAQFINDPNNQSYTMKNNSNPIREQIIINLIFNSNDEFNLKIYDSDKLQYEIPSEEPFPFDKDQDKGPINDTLYYATIYLSPFSINIIRKSSQEILFDSSQGDLLISQKFVTFSTLSQSTNLFGLGERWAYFQLQLENTYTLWNKDHPADINLNAEEPNNTYGQHPVYLAKERFDDDGKYNYHIVLLRSGAAMDVNYAKVCEEFNQLTYKLIGGIIDIKFFLSPELVKKSSTYDDLLTNTTYHKMINLSRDLLQQDQPQHGNQAEQVVRKYHEYLGGFTVPPFWSMGYHQCRWGYDTIQDIEDVVKGFEDNNLPLDAFWMDIDYMNKKFIFSIDEQKFSNQKVQDIKDKYKKKLVVIIDPSISSEPFLPDSTVPYKTMWDGLKSNVFMKDAEGLPWLGKQWAGPVYYVDYSHPNATQYWIDQFQEFSQIVKYDGIWLDMNEVGHFTTGKYNLSLEAQNNLNSVYFGQDDPKICDIENLNFPYLIQHQLCMSQRTVDVSLVHSDGTKEIDVHSLLALHEVVATYKAIENTLKTTQPFIITRSNSFGSGKYTGHWSGDNLSTFFHLKLSISSVIRHNLYGIPMVGADICGFNGDTNVQLCARWMQLGSFYPFSRNHNDIYQLSQEPFRLGPIVLASAQKNLRLRYSILRHYYSLFLNTQTGSIFKPLFFEFSNDEQTLNAIIINEQFLVGQDLLFIPVLEENATTVNGYFPKQTQWFNFTNGQSVISANDTDRSLNLTNQLDDIIPVFQRGGSIIPIQKVKNVSSTSDLNDEIFLKIAFNSNEQENQLLASGKILSLAQLNDSKLVTDYCMDGESCMVKVYAIFTKQSENSSQQIALKFNFQNKQSIAKMMRDQTKTIQIKSLKCIGLPKSVLQVDQIRQNINQIAYLYKPFSSIRVPIKFELIRKEHTLVIKFDSEIKLTDDFEIQIDI